jgi:hypothetical protein
VMNVLEGLTREEALACVFMVYDRGWGWFVHNGIVYSDPYHIGLPVHGCQMTVLDWKQLINAYYDAMDVKKGKKWVDVAVPLFNECVYGGVGFEEFYGNAGDSVGDIRTEIARTNARRKIEAFIRENGGSGTWAIWHNVELKAFMPISTCPLNTQNVGTISCATRELAEEVIRRYTPELSLLCGVEVRA